MTAANDQPGLDEIGTPLAEVSFCVVDLETTGASAESAITEIGAVLVRGGEVIGEFQTLVNPNDHIPALISVLTGITNQMVADAPRLGQVLGPFLEFARGAVLVAHNARFDVGFLKRGCSTHETAWPGFPVVDTVSLARHCLLRDEVPNCKLSTLAAHFTATTTPDHRALSDARATVDVLHGLLERVGNLGVSTLEDLLEFTRKVSPQRRAKRVWVQDLPAAPGVYAFHRDSPTENDSGTGEREILYVGKSKNIRQRVRSYFTSSEKRGRMEEMVRVASGVDCWPCATELEAEITELRMIAAHQPRYNRRSRNQDRQLWLKLTREAFPRLSIVRTVRDDDRFLGPFSSRATAVQVTMALQDAFAVRRCSTRLSARAASSSCALAEMGRCLAPCELGDNLEEYSQVVEQIRAALDSDTRLVVRTVGARLSLLAEQQRYEEAGTVHERLQDYLRSAIRHQRLLSVAGCAEIVAARHVGEGWEIHVVRHGRLAGAGWAARGDIPQAVARHAVATAQTVLPPPAGLPACSTEETKRVAHWLEQPGVRLISIEGEWCWPLHTGPGPGDLPRAVTVGSAS